MKTRIFTLLIMVVGISLLISAVDPFYLQMLEKGKMLYNEGKFEESLENLRIAEFGLLSETEYLKEIFVFSALCHFNLNRPKETLDVLDKISAELRIEDFSAIKVSEKIRPDWQQLLQVMEKKTGTPASIGTSLKTNKNISLMNSFNSIFDQSREMVNAGRFDQAEAGIKRLKKMNRKDIRIDYLLARICFEKKKYSDCVQRLREVYDANFPGLRDESLYYLVISYYFTGNYGQTLAFFQKIKNEADKEKLNTIVRKVKSERQRLVEKVSGNFNRNSFKKLIDSFEGDLFLARDILNQAMNRVLPGDPILVDIIQTASRYPQACDPDFYLLASDYLKKTKKMKSALDILKKSRYYNTRDIKYIEIYYRAGELYFQMKEWIKAMVEMAKVKAIKDGYKESDRYIENMQKLKQGG